MYGGCGKKTDGTLWAWGHANYGVLGQNSDNAHRSSPVQVPGTTWRTIAGARDTILATKTDGTLWAWGSNNRGKLGQNSPVNSHRSSPVQVGSGTDWSSKSYAICGSEAHIHAIKEI